MKAILVINKMPNSCDECEVRCTGYTGKQYAEKGITRPSWCPLRQLPEKKEDEDLNEYHRDLYADGWNNCLDEIIGENK